MDNCGPKRSTSVLFWRDPRIPYVETSLVVGSRHVFPRHAHDYFAIGLMEHGANYCLDPAVDKEVLTSGSMALINPGQMHTGNPARGVSSTYRMIFVEPSWVYQAVLEAGAHAGDVEFRRVVVAAPAAWSSLHALSSALAYGGTPLAIESLLTSALAGLVVRHGANPRPVQRVSREPGRIAIAQEYLRARPDAAITLEDLSTLVGLSRFHLLRAFRHTVGITPHAYHLQIRVEAARKLLRAGVPIAQAAAQAGFADQSHLNRVFKRYAGTTPGAYAGRIAS